MSRLIKLKFVFLLLIISISNHAYTKNHYDNYATTQEVFEIPGHGEISITVPKAWHCRFTRTDEINPPVITYYVSGADDEEIFQLNMSVLWDDGYERNVTSQDFIPSFIEKTGENILNLSDETALVLNEITGTSGAGKVNTNI